jgi:hypothetical protein
MPSRHFGSTHVISDPPYIQMKIRDKVINHIYISVLKSSRWICKVTRFLMTSAGQDSNTVVIWLKSLTNPYTKTIGNV